MTNQVIPAQAVEAAAKELLRIATEQYKSDYTLSPHPLGEDDEP